MRTLRLIWTGGKTLLVQELLKETNQRFLTEKKTIVEIS